MLLPTIVKTLDAQAAGAVLHDAWYGGKNKNLLKIDLHLAGNDDGSGFVIADVPLALVRPNENGDLYDGTANPERVHHYATQSIDTPVHLLFSMRGVRKGMTRANVMDGGHRVSARRLQGHESIPALMQRSNFDLLLALAHRLLADAKSENDALVERSSSAMDFIWCQKSMTVMKP